ncbi:MAG: threonine/serine dehydratase [Actinomycetota bacterium]|nr:threonine/serine dehydratase [Actinomycetota bacterium]
MTHGTGGTERRTVPDGLPVSIADVEEAARRIAGVVVPTPVLRADALDAAVGARVHLKAENLQRGGSFKLRGATNLLASLTDDERARGIVAYSSGNHARGVAIAARTLGIDAVVVMPHDAPPEKVAAVGAEGATIVGYDRYTEDRAAIAASIATRDGRTVVPPFDDPRIMAGQGTVALELAEQVERLDVLVVCLGGGGLLSGCAVVAADRWPGVRIIGVEPDAGDDHRRSRAAGHRVAVAVPRTIADGQATTMPGEHTWAVNGALVDEFVSVSDTAIVEAMRFVFDELNVVAEPSGASALAALLSGVVTVPVGARVGVTLSGGNVSVSRFARLLGETP